MEYGWNIPEDESLSFVSLSREFYYANLLIDEIISENVREVRRLLKVQRARADVVVPERGAAALHVLAGLESEDFAAAVTLRVLSRSTADPDVRSEEGFTPTHVAATYGRCRVLEVLLTNGANPSLVDYRLLLDAKDHAYNERQWQAFNMLTTYMAILENEGRLSKHLDPKNEFSSDQRNKANLTLDNCLYEVGLPNCSENNSKRLVYGERNENEEGDCDCLKKTPKAIPLDDNTADIVENHKRNMETYQFPVSQEEESFQSFSDKSVHYDMSTPKLGENKILATKHYLEGKLSWLHSIKSKSADRECSKNSCMEPEVNCSKSSVNIDRITDTNQSRSENNAESIKDTPNSNERESDMYIYGYAESSLKSKGSHHRTTVSSVCQNSYADTSKELNNNVLCKMSRIFLFILKKRHSAYRQLQS